MVPGVKSGDIRILAVFDKIPFRSSRVCRPRSPRGTQLLPARRAPSPSPQARPNRSWMSCPAVKKAMADPEHKKKMEASGLELRYMDAPELSAYWDQVDATLQPIIEDSKKK